MKILSLICAIVSLFASVAQAQQPEPEPGIYRGYITVARVNKALGVNDVTTLLVTGEIFLNGTSPVFTWTARNFEPSAKLGNPCAWQYLSYQNPSYIGDVELGDSGIRIPGGTTVPGSFKMTARSLAWKTTATKTMGGPRRFMTITTTFSITRAGAAPAP